MATHLQWSKAEKERQIKMAQEYIGQFGGPIADKSSAKLRSATFTDLHEIFLSIDLDNSGYLSPNELSAAADRLGFPFSSKKELDEKFKEIDIDGNGRISEAEFIEWWNGRNADKFAKKLHQQLSMTAKDEVALEKLLFAHEEETKK
mmetsp:Transcript_3947/g.9658  ORF Transcript_3947/g.9658 Transcript_3947/m.9658 type:complete len:147 (-) Transcript_3947:484-924(-)